MIIKLKNLSISGLKSVMMTYFWAYFTFQSTHPFWLKFIKKVKKLTKFKSDKNYSNFMYWGIRS